MLLLVLGVEGLVEEAAAHRASFLGHCQSAQTLSGENLGSPGGLSLYSSYLQWVGENQWVAIVLVAEWHSLGHLVGEKLDQ